MVALFCGTVSWVAEVTLAELTIFVPGAVVPTTATMKVKFPVGPVARFVPSVQVTVPEFPAPGVAQVNHLE